MKRLVFTVWPTLSPVWEAFWCIIGSFFWCFISLGWSRKPKIWRAWINVVKYIEESIFLLSLPHFDCIGADIYLVHIFIWYDIKVRPVASLVGSPWSVIRVKEAFTVNTKLSWIGLGLVNSICVGYILYRSSSIFYRRRSLVFGSHIINNDPDTDHHLHISRVVNRLLFRTLAFRLTRHSSRVCVRVCVP